jgi:hypothetical protein
MIWDIGQNEEYGVEPDDFSRSSDKFFAQRARLDILSSIQIT